MVATRIHHSNVRRPGRASAAGRKADAVEHDDPIIKQEQAAIPADSTKYLLTLAPARAGSVETVRGHVRDAGPFSATHRGQARSLRFPRSRIRSDSAKTVMVASAMIRSGG